MAKLDRLRYVFRCAACEATERVAIKTVVEGERAEPMYQPLWDAAPTGWTMLACESLELWTTAEQKMPMTFWLCPACSATPERSRALAALRHPIRILA